MKASPGCHTTSACGSAPGGSDQNACVWPLVKSNPYQGRNAWKENGDRISVKRQFQQSKRTRYDARDRRLEREMYPGVWRPTDMKSAALYSLSIR